MATIECPSCGHHVEVPKRRRAVAAAVVEFPIVKPTKGARALHADHVEKSGQRKQSARRGKREDARDYQLRMDHADTVRFLAECWAAGRVARFHADNVQPDAVCVWLPGPRGVFHPIAPITLTVAEVHEHASVIAKGTAWKTLAPVTLVADAA